MIVLHWPKENKHGFGLDITHMIGGLTHQKSIIHADLAETSCHRVDIFLMDPGFEKFHSKGCRDTWVKKNKG
jgi:hypothetical protein